MPLFRTRLCVLRAEREWSQAKLAAHVGVTRQTINSIEKGRFHPSRRQVPILPLQRKSFPLSIERNGVLACRASIPLEAASAELSQPSVGNLAGR
jgi:putative transcriptional regulator